MLNDWQLISCFRFPIFNFIHGNVSILNNAIKRKRGPQRLLFHGLNQEHDQNRHHSPQHAKEIQHSFSLFMDVSQLQRISEQRNFKSKSFLVVYKEKENYYIQAGGNRGHQKHISNHSIILVDLVTSSFAQFTKTVKFEEVKIELSILSSTQIAW